jgi:hypothetical protein
VGASIGGLRGSARENSALGAGIGAATAEIYAERMGLAGIREGTYDPNSKADQDLLSRQSQIVAALATGLAGKDPGAGVQYAQNAVENNAIQVLMAAPYLAAAVEGTALGANLAFYGSAALTGIGLGFFVKNFMDAAPEASEPQVESFPEAEPGAQSFVTPVHESGPQIHSTPVHDQARSSDRGFDIYNGPDASVLTRDVKPVEVYEVGEYWDLSRRSKGDNLDIHHAPQAHPAKQAIDSYDRSTAPSMSLPLREHKRIPNIRGDYSGNSRDLLANDVRNLRTHTKAPNNKIQELINLTKNKYPESFKKE